VALIRYEGLPEDLQAALFIVMHLLSLAPSVLPEILSASNFLR
jgi:hypothetical protein